ncbi:restriction endonuclease [Natronorubrum aibiense]|uniref:Restriction endonuclease type IV Mrr domain-containing protein n=1 Tax=Natronorubrum aibiense TaxID=348826 RepID=A0A5P9P3A6_9EURY|nr:restriction endonuclease [Natronorubrum aibiense]QFU82602.1 hypothetical protein GCU68_08750 [Natronorubrum aibiense]
MVPPSFHNWISSHDHATLEKVVQDILEYEEWDTTRTKATGDGGHDVILNRGRREVIVEVVNREGVGPGEIREIAGAASEHNVSETAVTAVSFTKGALETADKIERNSDTTIDLWDAECLYNKLIGTTLEDFRDRYPTN